MRQGILGEADNFLNKAFYILNSNDFNCYDEDGLPVKIDKLSEPGVEIIPLFEVQGVKFSSRSF